MIVSENSSVNLINLNTEVLNASQLILNISELISASSLIKMNLILIRYLSLLYLLVNYNNLCNSLKTEYIKNEFDKMSENSFKEF